jgi:UDP-glucose 4-epimerase
MTRGNRAERPVAITGGAGFIGSNLARRCAQGGPVRVVDDLSTGHEANIAHIDASLSRTDVASDDLIPHFSDCGRVFHLAASVGNKRAIENPVRDSVVNVLGTLNVLEAAVQVGAETVVLSSSAGIFGELKTMPIAEDHPLDPDSPYGVSKLAAERHGLVYSKLYDIDVVALRYFNVYGPNQRFDAYGNVIPIFVFQMLEGRPISIFGDGDQTRDFINVADVVDANIAASEVSGLSGAFNLGSATRVTINDLARMLHEIVGTPWNVGYGPERPGDVRHSLAEIRRAQEAFGFEPKVDLYDGLVEYVEWAKTMVETT